MLCKHKIEDRFENEEDTTGNASDKGNSDTFVVHRQAELWRRTRCGGAAALNRGLAVLARCNLFPALLRVLLERT